MLVQLTVVQLVFHFSGIFCAICVFCKDKREEHIEYNEFTGGNVRAPKLSALQFVYYVPSNSVLQITQPQCTLPFSKRSVVLRLVVV